MRLRRMRGEVVETSAVVDRASALALPSMRGNQQTAPTKGNASSFAGLIEEWSGVVLDRDDKAVRDMETAVRFFRAAVGEDHTPESITRDDIEKFHDHLFKSKGLHWKTVVKRVGQIKTLFERAVEAARWVPLLALYTGARMEELARPHVADIRKENGIDYLDITDAGPYQKLKNDFSRRQLPIHANLKTVGFLRYVVQVRQAGADRLFPLLERGSKGDWSGSWGKWYGRYVRGKLGITDERKVFRSFRHHFKTTCRKVFLTEEIHDCLTGHGHGKDTGSSVGRDYGDMPLVTLAEGMAKVHFPDVPLPIVIPAEAETATA